ncbi:MAG TPA: HEPN domain-containing protein [Blastocatellia bacterium]|nr:HEPN domain-containing protein [Blastocatellia bacterium]
MKRSLAHLPKHKQQELIEATSIIKVNPGVEMVILFGSYARGDWVEDTYTEGHITYEYKSDFDILVIVKNRQYARRIMTWDKMEGAIHNSRTIKTWATVIVHDIAEVNRALSRGRYFFTDIKKEGVLLYDSKRYKLEKAQKLSSEERKQIAQEDYRSWSKSAREFLTSFEDAFKRRHYNIAAFQLHQATERFYTAILLVFTHYKPKLHDIKTLGKQAGNLDPRFLPIFPRKTPEERRLFELLRKAYTEARYNRNYKITKKELEYLAARVKKLQKVTKEVCKERIESYA